MKGDFEAVRENLYPGNHGAIEDWEAFPWHRDRANRIQAHKVHSSQAITGGRFSAVLTVDHNRCWLSRCSSQRARLPCTRRRNALEALGTKGRQLGRHDWVRRSRSGPANGVGCEYESVPQD